MIPRTDLWIWPCVSKRKVSIALRICSARLASLACLRRDSIEIQGLLANNLRDLALDIFHRDWASMTGRLKLRVIPFHQHRPLGLGSNTSAFEVYTDTFPSPQPCSTSFRVAPLLSFIRPPFRLFFRLLNFSNLTSSWSIQNQPSPVRVANGSPPHLRFLYSTANFIAPCVTQTHGFACPGFCTSLQEKERQF